MLEQLVLGTTPKVTTESDGASDASDTHGQGAVCCNLCLGLCGLFCFRVVGLSSKGWKMPFTAGCVRLTFWRETQLWVKTGR